VSLEANKALVRRVFDEAFNERKLGALDEVFSPTFVDASTPEQEPGPKGVKGYFTAIHAGFPDMQVAIGDWIAEGDKVVVRTIWRGTHTGEYEGIAPTGKQVTRTMIHIFRVEDGRIQEEWAEGESLEQLLMQ
jgi:predicted ester cyclase